MSPCTRRSTARLAACGGTMAAMMALGIASATPTHASPGTTSTAPTNAPSTSATLTTEPMRVAELEQRLSWAWMRPGPVTGVMTAQNRRAIVRFQAKFGLPKVGVAGPRTRALLRKLTVNNYGIDPRCKAPGKALCVNKSLKLVRVLENGKLVASLDARFGIEGMSTREGAFSVYWKNWNHVSSIYRTSMPYAMFFSGGQAIHYSADFAAKGYAGGSHGCVNVRDKAKARWLFRWTPRGTKVVVHAA